VCTSNRHIYEKLLCHILGQIVCRGRETLHELNPEIDHAFWLKAEGLGCALRLLYAYVTEFRDLVECGDLAARDVTMQRLFA